MPRKKKTTKIKNQESKTLIDKTMIKVGDTVTLYVKGHSPYTGIIISHHGGLGPNATFTVRSILSGVGVEKIYPLHSPLISKIEKIKSAKIKRAKLYFLRERVGRKATLKSAK